METSAETAKSETKARRTARKQCTTTNPAPQTVHNNKHDNEQPQTNDPHNKHDNEQPQTNDPHNKHDNEQPQTNNPHNKHDNEQPQTNNPHNKHGNEQQQTNPRQQVRLDIERPFSALWKQRIAKRSKVRVRGSLRAKRSAKGNEVRGSLRAKCEVKQRQQTNKVSRTALAGAPLRQGLRAQEAVHN